MSLKKEKTVQWGDQKITLDNVYDSSYFPNEKVPQNLKKEIECISEVAEFAKAGKINLYVHDEVAFETWGLPNKIEISEEFFGAHIERYIDVSYSRTVLSAFQDGKELFLEHINFIEDEKLELLKKHIVKPNAKGDTKSNQLVDAYNIFRAEKCGGKYFLTTDLKLVNTFECELKGKLNISVVTPSKLVDIFQN